MIDLSTFVAFFKDFNRPYPARDWTIILFVSVLLCVSGFVLAAWLFLKVQTGSLIGTPTEVPRPPIPVTKKEIQTVLETYQARAANFANKSFAPVDLNDPRPRTVKK